MFGFHLATKVRIDGQLRRNQASTLGYLRRVGTHALRRAAGRGPNPGTSLRKLPRSL